jgi:glutathione S-transferase
MLMVLCKMTGTLPGMNQKYQEVLILRRRTCAVSKDGFVLLMVRDARVKRAPHHEDDKGRQNNMITLYHCHGARSFRPLWMLEELGLPYDLKMLPFPPRVFAKEYLALNPLGTIPFMIDGETKMSESSGICHYLGTRYGPTPLIVGIDDPAYGAFLNWMYFSDATLTFPQTLVLRYSQLEPEERRNPQVAGDYAKWFLGRLRVVEAATGKAETLCAGRFTAADIVIGYALRLAENIGLAKDFGPNVAAYWQRLQQRDGFKRAVAAEDLAGVEQKVARRS